MANVVRLVSGGSIQVRTGVIQGIGPQGPTGVQGNQGVQGEQGPVGETGPMGAILQQSGRSDVGTANTMSANSDTVIGFGTVYHDQMGCFGPDISKITLIAEGDYLLSCWLRFNDAAASAREVWFQTGATTIARTSRLAGTGAPFYVDLSYPYRATTSPVVINVLARSGAATGASLGSLTVTRIGSGPVGAAGPQGIQGPVGATGAQGPQGVPGSASSGFTTYAKLIGPN